VDEDFGILAGRTWDQKNLIVMLVSVWIEMSNRSGVPEMVDKDEYKEQVSCFRN